MSFPFSTGYVIKTWQTRKTIWRGFYSCEGWALRDSDLPLANGNYWRYGPREYMVPDIQQASVWRYRQAAYTYRDRFLPEGEVVRVEAAFTGQRTNDGRKHLLAVAAA